MVLILRAFEVCCLASGMGGYFSGGSVFSVDDFHKISPLDFTALGVLRKKIYTSVNNLTNLLTHPT